MMVSSLPRSPPRAIVILLSLVPGLLAELNQCYLPNGTDINSIDGEFQYNYVPCMKYEGVQSMCCSAWDHLCTTNGLCYSTLQNLYYRDACTDPTWQDPACTKLFMDGTAGDTTVSLTPCYDGSYCLWANTTGADCCQAGNGVFIGDDGNPTKVKPTKARSNIGLPTFTVTSTVTHTAASVTSQAETNGTSSRSSLSSADKAGIGVGVTLGVLIILGLVAVILFMRRKLSQAYSELGSKEDHSLSQDAHQGYSHESKPAVDHYAQQGYPNKPLQQDGHYVRPEELNAHQVSQLPGDGYRHELEQPGQIGSPGMVNRKPVHGSSG